MYYMVGDTNSVTDLIRMMSAPMNAIASPIAEVMNNAQGNRMPLHSVCTNNFVIVTSRIPRQTQKREEGATTDLAGGRYRTEVRFKISTPVSRYHIREL